MLGIWLLTLELAFASALSSGMAALLGTGGVFVVCYLLSMLPALARFLPPRLLEGLSLLNGTLTSSDILPALFVALALSLVQGALCIAGIRRKQL